MWHFRLLNVSLAEFTPLDGFLGGMYQHDMMVECYHAGTLAKDCYPPKAGAGSV